MLQEIKPHVPLSCQALNCHKRELFEFNFRYHSFSKPLLILPWGTIFQQGRWDILEELPKNYFYATLTKSTWSKTRIFDEMKNLGIKTVFNCNTPTYTIPYRWETYIDDAWYKVLPQIKIHFYSFIGYDSHPVREAIFEKLNSPTIKQRGLFHGYIKDDDIRESEKKEYINVLGASRFSICPIGFGSSTMRFWESLSAGAIPILISDTQKLMPNWDWDETIIRISEHSVLKDPNVIERVIKSITREKEDRLRVNCLKAFAYFNDVQTLQRFIEERIKD